MPQEQWPGIVGLIATVPVGALSLDAASTVVPARTNVLARHATLKVPELRYPACHLLLVLLNSGVGLVLPEVFPPFAKDWPERAVHLRAFMGVWIHVREEETTSTCMQVEKVVSNACEPRRYVAVHLKRSRASHPPSLSLLLMRLIV